MADGNGGIIQQRISTNSNEVTGYEPERIDLDEERDTVAGRIRSVVDENSPLMQQARTQALKDQNRRGTLNSSMATQAGQAAVYQAAMPIAQQDAATSYDARRTNTAFGNEALARTADAAQAREQQRAGGIIQSRLQHEAGDIEAGLIETRGDVEAGLIEARGDVESRLLAERGEIEMALQDASAEDREHLLQLQGDIDKELQDLRNEGAKELTDLEMEWRNVLNTNQGAAIYLSEYTTAIGSILANPDIPANQKQGLVDQLKNQLETTLAVLGGVSDMDLSGLLDFDNSGGGTPPPDWDWDWWRNQGR